MSVNHIYYRATCDLCDTEILGDRMFNIDNRHICEDCTDNFIDWFDNYPKNPHCDICGTEIRDKFYKVDSEKYCEECFVESFEENAEIEVDYDRI